MKDISTLALLFSPFAFILQIGYNDRNWNAISNPHIEISVVFLLYNKYLQSHFSDYCWTEVAHYF